MIPIAKTLWPKTKRLLKLKKKRGEGKTYYFSETFASLELAKKAVERKKHGHGRLKRSKKTLINTTIDVIKLNNVLKIFLNNCLFIQVKGGVFIKIETSFYLN
jgi:hypothetical protein